MLYATHAVAIRIAQIGWREQALESLVHGSRQPLCHRADDTRDPPYLFLTLDRILGPAWVLARTASCAWARRRWSFHRVLVVGDARAIVEAADGRRLVVRTEVTLERGPAYLEVGPRPHPAEPYRSDDTEALLYAAEPAQERAKRRRDLLTAALGMLSGLVWMALPLSLLLADALTECVPPSHLPELCG